MILKTFATEHDFVRAQIRGDIKPHNVLSLAEAAKLLKITPRAVHYAVTKGAALQGWAAGHRKFVDARSAKRYRPRRHPTDQVATA